MAPLEKKAGNIQVGFDAHDFAILSTLSENSRFSLRKIAAKVGKSTGFVQARIQKLEKSKAIKKYSVFVDYDLLGFELQAVVRINIAKGKLFEVEKKIASHPNVCSVFDVTGQADVIVVARFRSKKSLDAFLKKIQSFDFVRKTETSIILNTIKEENVQF